MIDNSGDYLVNGCFAFDPRSNMWIPFETSTDALFSKLLLDHNFSWGAINIVLCIIKLSGFNSADLTFEDASDIERRVSTHRRKQVEALSDSSHLTTSNTAAMHHVVLELLVESMMEKLEPIYVDAENGRTATNGSISLRRDLMAMCLVHRSWTTTIRANMCHRAVIRSQSGLRKLLRSSSCFFPIRDIVIRRDSLSGDDARTIGSEAIDDLPILLKALTICSSSRIRRLYLDYGYPRPQFYEGLVALLDTDSLQSSLEELRLQHGVNSEPVGHFSKIFLAISRQRRLRILSLKIPTEPEPYDLDLDGVFPPCTLKTLALLALESHMDLEILRPYMAWLTQTREGFQIDNLALHLPLATSSNSTRLPYEFSKIIRGCLPSLRELSIEGFRSDRDATNVLESEILLHCTSLRRLWMNCGAEFKYTFLIPKTVEEMRFCVEAGWRLPIVDKMLSTTIQGTQWESDQSFRKLHVNYERYLEDLDDRARDWMRQTYAVCKELGIQMCLSAMSGAHARARFYESR